MFRVISTIICLSLLLVFNIQAEETFESIESEQHGIISENPEAISVRGAGAIVGQRFNESEDSENTERRDYLRRSKVFIPSP